VLETVVIWMDMEQGRKEDGRGGQKEDGRRTKGGRKEDGRRTR